MDILLVQGSVYELPTSRRVGVIVHDGTTDLRLWPGPGADREVANAYGPDLQRVLDAEKVRTGGQPLPVGTLLRLHPGRLHCDFLLWFCSRGPEAKGFQADAPDQATIEKMVHEAIEFAGERHAIRIAFPALGAGPNAIEDGERLGVVARAASTYDEQRVQKGLPSRIEEVLVCDPRMSVVSAARKRVGSLAKTPPPEKAPVVEASTGSAKPARAKAASKVGAKPRAKGKGSTRKPKLEEADISKARAVSKPWDRAARYGVGSWFVHAKFGVGRVDEITAEGFVVVLFEDGEQRKLIHARP
jgi:O-acetyl-ADP-ribose deacetylase (regulator of RNase III)